MQLKLVDWYVMSMIYCNVCLNQKYALFLSINVSVLYLVIKNLFDFF